MNNDDYLDLLKKANKEYQTARAAKKYPYLAFLDNIIKDVEIVSRVDLGRVVIPLDRIAGTDTEGRSNAFSPGYLPILELSSEFASKYIALYNSCEEEGMREPVIGFEYLGMYYIREGNKRVSVSKQLGLSEIDGYITRLIPAKSEEPEVVINYEYINFYEKTRGINFLYFTKATRFKNFLKFVAPDSEYFTEKQKEDVYSSYVRFKTQYKKKSKKPMLPDDAYYLYVKLMGYEETKDKIPAEIDDAIQNIWKEFWAETLESPIVVSEKPMDRRVPLIKKIALKAVGKQFKIAFVHMGNIENSAWVYSHELGRQYLEQSELGEDVDTHSFYNISIDEADDFMEKLCKEKYDIIFTTSAQHASACTKVALNHPEVKILNCSLNDSTKSVRTYYLRTYECKFLLGMIAGALTQTGKIAYVADYPVYGTIVSINAFALGVSVINPSAQIFLSWTSRKTGDDYWQIDKTGCDIISNLDWSSPKYLTKKFGLYANEEDPENLAAPLWDWGKLYEAIVSGIRNGNWEMEENEVGKKSLSYWWGLSSGVVDMIYSKRVPAQTMKLINFIKGKICNGEYNIFSGELRFSDGTYIESEKGLTYMELIEMDKLLWNILGSIPSSDELKEETVSLAKVQGALEKEED